MLGAIRHHLDHVTRLQAAIDDADVGDHAAVGVVDRVEDHRARRRIGIALRRRHELAHAVHQRLDALTRLARHPQHILRLAADDVRDLLRVLLRVGGRQVDLVKDRNNLKIILHGQVQVRQRLRLDALRRVDQQNRALARLQRARDLVGEVHVAGGVDQMQHDLLAGMRTRLRHPRQPHVLRLDGDAALALDVHVVQVLVAHVARLDHAGHLQDPVRQGRLAVVDVGDDAEVADLLGIRERLRREIPGHVGHAPYYWGTSVFSAHTTRRGFADGHGRAGLG